MHNIPLKAGFDTYILRTRFKEIGGPDIKTEIIIKTKRASRSVPAESSDGKRLLIVLKPSSAWRQVCLILFLLFILSAFTQ